MKNKIHVTKATGETEEFSLEKLKNSLVRAKAGSKDIEHILEQVLPQLYEGISTQKIYAHAFKLLRQNSRSNAARYYLKKGIMDLGPSGFPFEKFVAALFHHQGYRVSNGQFFKGQCVTHEIDVLAEKENETMMMECKYQNNPEVGVDVKVPLYIHSRFEDILSAANFPKENFTGWIVTNSRFTKDALDYGSCIGIKMLSWSWPKNRALKDLIDNSGLFPVTCLTSLTKLEKNALLEKNIVLVKDLLHRSHLLSEIGMKENRISKVLEESTSLCN
jgi:Holliday junction resolvase-like predicted endonuclease